MQQLKDRLKEVAEGLQDLLQTVDWHGTRADQIRELIKKAEE